jgi:hypothetical protein
MKVGVFGKFRFPFAKNMEIWTQRHGDMETWRYGDMEIWRHGDMETWRHRDMEMEPCKHGDMETQRMETHTERHGDIKRKTENRSPDDFPYRLPFAHCANGNCPFIAKDTNGNNLFANRLNGLAHHENPHYKANKRNTYLALGSHSLSQNA